MASECGEGRGAKAGKPGNSYSALFGLLYVALASLELAIQTKTMLAGL